MLLGSIILLIREYLKKHILLLEQNRYFSLFNMFPPPLYKEVAYIILQFKLLFVIIIMFKSSKNTRVLIITFSVNL